MSIQALEVAWAQCPYCGEPVELTIDRSMLNESYSEDCPVCCRPMIVTARADEDGNLVVDTGREDA